MSEESPFEMYRNARTLIEEGKPREADVLLSRAVEAKPDFADALYLLARCRVMLGSYRSAANACKRLTRMLPDDVEVYELYALCLDALEEYRPLRKVYERILTIQPQREDIVVSMARMFCDDSRPGKAVSVLRKYLGVLGPRPNLYHALGETFLRAGKIARAEEAFRKALEVKPEFRPARRALEHLGRTDLVPEDASQSSPPPNDLEGVRDRIAHFEYARALDILEEWEKGGTAIPEARRLLLKCRLRLGRIEEAEAQASEMARKNPEDPEMHFFLGLARSMSSNHEAARASLLRALELRPEYLEAQCQLALVERRLGNVREAAKIFDTALSDGNSGGQ